ncbi:MAG: Gfo/Idh/MocA family oxidoreductase [Verrucomicrobia bacterium]|jgi:predicted dehydrogenase|nr:Gfo/Idh/MocA family oxidoreductase [Verrucomicrobiota bacterium]
MKRRAFIKTTATAAAGGFVLPQFSIGQAGPSANGKLNIAMVGAGGIASMAYAGLQGENIVALCDVDSARLHQHADRFPAITQARTFKDFRVMLDKMGDEIDAVCISTPDHTHFPITMAVMERGLHVYTQKPLTHNIWQARTLRKARDKYNVVTNMGNQGHATAGIRQMREWVEADVFGQITEVHSWLKGGGFGFPDGYQVTEDTVPGTLDYNLWTGPAKAVPFHRHFHPGGWRRFRAFGAGMLGDWFTHVADGPIWILDLYEPVAVEAELSEGGSDWLTPHTCRLRYEFLARGSKKPCTFTWHNGDSVYQPAKPEAWTWPGEFPNHGSLFIGDRNIGYTDARSSNPRLANRDEMKAFKAEGFPEEKYPRVAGGPFQEWARAIKDEGPEPGSNFEYSGRLTECMLLGGIAAQYGGRIEWDAKAMKITNRPELNDYLKEPVRQGWSYGTELWS